MGFLTSVLRAPARLFSGNKPTVVVVSLYGAISAEARPSRGLSANGVEQGLKRAFGDKSVKAVVLAINSPGGAPTQARMIMDRVRHLAQKSELPVISYIEDVGASGGYLIALAGEEIWADPFAIVGSIGVVAAGFGFHEAIGKLGIDRRVHHAGDNKVRLDPFQPEKKEDAERLERLLDESHGLFIDLVKEGRGERISGEDRDVFSGDFYLAGEGKKLGLIDEVGDLRTLLKQRYGDDVKIRTMSGRREGLFGALGASVTAGLVDALVFRLRDEGLRQRLGR